MRNFLDFLDMNRRLVIAITVGSALLIVLQLFVQSSSKECIGIADTKETVISFEIPVMVKRVYVLPGQAVRKGQPLLEVEVPETKLKLLEVQTMLESLESEQNVRNVLLDTFTGKGTDKGNDRQLSVKSPISQEIAGLRRQLAELQNQQSQAVRYAEVDGVVATVMYGPREQAAPFSPIITLTPFVPNYVYGFINEKVNSELKIGETVIVEPLNDRTRGSTGRVISIGARITAFSDRLQMIHTTAHDSKGIQNNIVPAYFGRELVVSLDPKNSIVIGEKVHIRAREHSRLSELGFQAFADTKSDGTTVTSELLATKLPLEASGLVMMPGSNDLLAASDEDGPQGSPFWTLPSDGSQNYVNLPMHGLKKIDDVEALSHFDGHYYALASMSKKRSGKVKKDRNLMIRFTVGANGVEVDRSFDLRAQLITALQSLPVLQAIHSKLDDIEVESLAVFGDDAYIALKEPQMPDGSSVILRLTGFIRQLNEGSITAVLADVQAVVRMENPNCDKPERVSDLIKTAAGLVVLGNCRSSENMGQLWWLADNAPSQLMTQITMLRNGRPEGMAVGTDLNSIYLVSDNGKKMGADLLKVTLPTPLQ